MYCSRRIAKSCALVKGRGRLEGRGTHQHLAEVFLFCGKMSAAELAIGRDTGIWRHEYLDANLAQVTQSPGEGRHGCGWRAISAGRWIAVSFEGAGESSRFIEVGVKIPGRQKLG